MKCADYTGEMNPVSQTAASLVVFVVAITANDWIRDGARFVAYLLLEYTNFSNEFTL